MPKWSSLFNKVDFGLSWTGFSKAKTFIQLNNDPKALLLRREKWIQPLPLHNSANTVQVNHSKSGLQPKVRDFLIFIIISAKPCISGTVRNVTLLKSNYSIKSEISVEADTEGWMNVMWSGISFHIISPPLINLCPSISSSDPLFWHSGQEVGRALISFPNTSHDFWICTCLNTSNTSASRQSMLSILNMCNSYTMPAPFSSSLFYIIAAHRYTHTSVLPA